MAENPKKFYLTTPIYYVNARPHIGHAYTTIVGDVLARRHRLLGEDVFFLTGTDEHGQKIERSAAAAGIPPQQFADEVAASFEGLWKRMGITHDKFIRTTSPEHKLGVQKLWRELESRGHIYLSSYTGAYCVSDEAFVDLPVGTPCPDCGRLLEQVTEENYFFKLSKYQPQLIDLIESGTLAVEPETRRNEVLSFLRGDLTAFLQRPEIREMAVEKKQFLLPEFLNEVYEKGFLDKSKSGEYSLPDALRDLSISRSSFKWGIPVPDNPKHVIYVWLDALTNYISALGYGSRDESLFKEFWQTPSEGSPIHLVGKEIIRFHCVYWPAFLLAAGLPLPKKVQAHGWLLFEESKMSKSRGNIVRTETILDAFGTHYRNELVRLGQPEPTKADADLFAADVLRYFLLREIPFGNDGSFSFDALIQRYNSDLANGYGNLVKRTLTLIESQNARIPEMGDSSCVSAKYNGNELIAMASTQLGQMLVGNIKDNLPKEPTESQYLITVMISFIGVTDDYLSANAPWKLNHEVAGEKEIRDEILYTAAESIRIITALLYPILPHTTAKVWAQLGLGDIEQAAKNGDLKNLQWGGLKPGTKLGPLAPIFPRAPKELAQIMTNIENPTPIKPEPATETGAPYLATAPSSPDVGSQDAPAVATPRPEESPTITIDDFIKIDLRAATILVAERIPKADKLLRLEVDLGPLGRRQILSGIAEHYTPEELIGRRIVVIANLAPRKMRGLESHGMLLAASEGPESGNPSAKPILATFGEDIAPGSRVK